MRRGSGDSDPREPAAPGWLRRTAAWALLALIPFLLAPVFHSLWVGLVPSTLLEVQPRAWNLTRGVTYPASDPWGGPTYFYANPDEPFALNTLYSSGPNRMPERGGGDDRPYGQTTWRSRVYDSGSLWLMALGVSVVTVRLSWWQLGTKFASLWVEVLRVQFVTCLLGTPLVLVEESLLASLPSPPPSSLLSEECRVRLTATATLMLAVVCARLLMSRVVQANGALMLREPAASVRPGVTTPASGGPEVPPPERPEPPLASRGYAGLAGGSEPMGSEPPVAAS